MIYYSQNLLLGLGADTGTTTSGAGKVEQKSTEHRRDGTRAKLQFACLVASRTAVPLVRNRGILATPTTPSTSGESQQVFFVAWYASVLPDDKEVRCMATTAGRLKSRPARVDGGGAHVFGVDTHEPGADGVRVRVGPLRAFSAGDGIIKRRPNFGALHAVASSGSISGATWGDRGHFFRVAARDRSRVTKNEAVGRKPITQTVAIDGAVTDIATLNCC